MRINSLSLGLALAFAACTGGGAFAEDLTGTLKKIKDNGVITLGTRESSKPFSYIDKENKTVGFTVDLCNRVVDVIRNKISAPDLKIKYLTTAPAARIPLLANGTLDMECSTTSITLSRMHQVAFSSPTFVVGARILTKVTSGVSNWEDLKGKIIGVAQGTNGEKTVKSLVETPAYKGTKVITFADHAAGLLAVENDRVDGYVTDDIVLYGIKAGARQEAELKVTGDPLTFETYAIVIRRDDPDFRLVVDTALSEMYRSGEIAAIYKKWFEPLGVPMSEANVFLYKIAGFMP
ncbi:amino acid ABC transporter substrate-binding protein [Bradyrhizobium sp. Tv2a-2]|uniref:amino acid ABC transporter substrate-binding protein n=1 Tax=Bradyrhizobium sp. Tv2a-2 TaxID=113395 RepID=UPI00041D8F89|nr:amino acid ABC transporter substrate-binding protein [Bradyrhizobium sp. Tv2a-2]